MPPLPVRPDIDTPVRPLPVRPGDLGARLSALWSTATPGAKIARVVEAPTPAVLDEAKAKLQSLGITDPEQPRRHDPDAGSRRPPRADRSSAHQRQPPSRTPPTRPATTPPFAPMAGWVQTESVLVADDLDLSNKTIHIAVDAVSHFWLIVRRLRCNPGAKITFTPTVNPRVAGGGRSRSPSPAQPSFDPNARASTASSGAC